MDPFWAAFLDDAKELYRRLRSEQRFDDADWFVEHAVQDRSVPLGRSS